MRKLGNRRIPNGTYGGVRGREKLFNFPSYSILTGVKDRDKMAQSASNLYFQFKPEGASFAFFGFYAIVALVHIYY
jgi:hypothetical protein